MRDQYKSLAKKYEQVLNEGIADVAADVGRVVGRTFRGMAQRAADTQAAGGRTTADIFGTHYPRRVRSPINYPKDFEKSVSDLKSRSIDTEEVANRIAVRVKKNYAELTGRRIDISKMDDREIKELRSMIDTEVKSLKGLDKSTQDSIRRETEGILDLLFRY